MQKNWKRSGYVEQVPDQLKDVDRVVSPEGHKPNEQDTENGTDVNHENTTMLNERECEPNVKDV
jgi:hypothetical protein